ncbi:site-specific DNA-methyltransferase [Thiocystis violacea]|uniref:site-specific DNA-methyltransferase n=1 Tax=Thiocystis violacea TaxID=13725 RepID=UPI00190358A1|nr:site-specific DNA-methyltransferase [Thiocystis violacea]MBK1718112.1 site-specific DNA-methyltransferase [Thiocystis violacea]
MKKLTREDGASPDLVADNIERLRELFPEIFADGRIDFDALKQALGESVDDREERYSFTWHGKSRAKQIAQTPSSGTLRPCPDESVNWETTKNIFIEGDNLEVLKLLQKSYHRKVKMIYIDPPYNTGKEFIYPDKWQDNLDTYLRYTGQVDDEGFKVSANAETSGRYHTNWLNMMYPRLKVARNLLRDDGVIFVSIDDHESHNLRQLMDEVFGSENFLGQISVVSNPRGRQSEIIATTHEYVLGFAREIENAAILGERLSDEAEGDYKYSTPDGRRYRTRGLRHRGNASRRVDRPNMYFPIYVDPNSRTVSLVRSGSFTEEVLPRKSTGQDGRWEWGPETVQHRLNRLEGVFISHRGEWDIYQREYLEDESGGTRRMKWKSIWDESEINYQNGKGELKELFGESPFDYPKPTYMLAKLIEGATSIGDVVLDFFAGSGTTGHACYIQGVAESINRRFILVQLPESTGLDEYPTIADVAKARLHAASAALTGNGPSHQKNMLTFDSDLGFRVFKLSSSNIKPWDAEFDSMDQDLLESIDNIKSDRSEDDVLYELLLKYGLDLAIPTETRDIEGRKVTLIGAGALIVCLADNITLEVVSGIAALKDELQPEVMRVVFKDAGFANDVVKTNAAQILKQAGIDDVKSL